MYKRMIIKKLRNKYPINKERKSLNSLNNNLKYQ